MAKTASNRILPTSSAYGREHLLYVQEIGTLTSQSPHVSTRNNIFSFLFFVVVEGSGTFTYCGETTPLHAGDCIFINCRNTYSHESSEKDPWTLTWVHFYGNTLTSLYDYYLSLSYSYQFHPGNLTEILTTLSSLYHTLEQKNAMTELLSHKYLTDIITLAFSENLNAGETLSVQNKLEQIRTYLMTHYHERLSLDQLSTLFFISKYHLSREYKHYFGTTLLNDLTSIRLSNAKSMLRFTDASVEQVAIACGFSDSAYFIRVFKSAENMTPFLYRSKW